jgi:hypothetical protein
MNAALAILTAVLLALTALGIHTLQAGLEHCDPGRHFQD